MRLEGSAADGLDDFGTPDILHDNGLWRAHNHRLSDLAESRRIPRIVSTRGMLEPWAMGHKSWKKRFAWRLYQRSDLGRAVAHHATAAAEAANVERFRLGVPVRMIPNGVDIPDVAQDFVAQSADAEGVAAEGAAEWPPDPESAVRTAIFLGRIYPVKGLPMLVEAWARVRPAGWRLIIAGPDESGHRAVIERAVRAEGIGDSVAFAGPLLDTPKKTALLSADLFILPTHSESFGMAIAEALAHGLPVLTTTGAPWPMLSRRGCGWSVNPTVEGIAEGLREATNLDSRTLGTMGARGRAFVAEEFGWPQTAAQFIELYHELRAGTGYRVPGNG